MLPHPHPHTQSQYKSLVVLEADDLITLMYSQTYYMNNWVHQKLSNLIWTFQILFYFYLIRLITCFSYEPLFTIETFLFLTFFQVSLLI